VPADSTALDRWAPSLSPDRQTLLLAPDDKSQGSAGSASGGRHLVAYDLETGIETLSGWTATGAADSLYMVGTPVEWRDSTWILPRLETEGLRLGPEGDADPSRALVVTDPRLHLTRLDLADDALSGPAHTTIWGTSVSTLSWRWPEAVLVAGVALGVLLWLRRRRSVRTRAQAG
jgi:hypothetical protein